ncbi:MAG TPA: CoA-disulfide reductase [Coriobacteriia bacterium]|nr:CoA-disulfide reductase [Coriobacteriia bacterium]
MGKRILIVGGVAGGATAAARIRRLDETAEIIMFERGVFVSFANCGLPYHVGGVIAQRQELLMQTVDGLYDRYRIDVRVRQEVLSVDAVKREVTVKRLKDDSVYRENYDVLLLAPGAQPILPDISEAAAEAVFTLHTMGDMDGVIKFIKQREVKHAVVIGGGFIGLETAENLKYRGIDVSLVQRSAQVMPQLDPEMAGIVHKELRDNGIELLLNAPLETVCSVDEPEARGETSSEASGDVAVVLADGRVITTDMVVAATGIRPLTVLAESAGLELGDFGGVLTNEHMLTSDSNIYAVGDSVEVKNMVTGAIHPVPLAGPANRQARIAADNICGIASKYNGAQGSSIIKVFNLTVACTGINEKTALKEGLDYDKIYLPAFSHAVYYPDPAVTPLKVLFEKGTGRILGATVIGREGADKRCDVLATVIRLGGTARDLQELELCYAPPYSSAKDPVNVAGYMIEDLMEGLVEQIFWYDVEALARDGSVTLIDTRGFDAYNKGSIEGFINIPVDFMRDRLDEIDKDKPVILLCQTGLRSYVGVRLLTQLGYDAKHISGGHTLYSLLQESGVTAENRVRA